MDFELCVFISLIWGVGGYKVWGRLMANLRKEAKGRECQVRLPGICNFNPETTVLAHYRMAGLNGVGQKPDDIFGAWACSSCHDECDRRTRKNVLPTDQLISFKFLLNKKDITIVVAPERGQEIDVRQVGARIMRLAEKNAAAFARQKGKNLERQANIDKLTQLRDEKKALLEQKIGELKELEALKAQEETDKAIDEQERINNSKAQLDSWLRQNGYQVNPMDQYEFMLELADRKIKVTSFERNAQCELQLVMPFSLGGKIIEDNNYRYTEHKVEEIIEQLEEFKTRDLSAAQEQWAEENKEEYNRTLKLLGIDKIKNAPKPEEQDKPFDDERTAQSSIFDDLKDDIYKEILVESYESAREAYFTSELQQKNRKRIEKCLAILSEKGHIPLTHDQYMEAINLGEKKGFSEQQLNEELSQVKAWVKALANGSDVVKLILGKTSKQYKSPKKVAVEYIGRQLAEAELAVSEPKFQSVNLANYASYLSGLVNALDSSLVNVQPKEELIEITGKEFGEFDTSTAEGKKALREKAFEYLKSLAENDEKVYSKALKADVGFTKSGAKKYKQLSANPIKSMVAAKIKDLIARGTQFKDSLEDYEGKVKLTYHYLKAPLKLEGNEYGVRMVIREDSNGEFHYDLQVKDDLTFMDSVEMQNGGSVSVNKSDFSHHSQGQSDLENNNTLTLDDVSSGYVLNLFVFDKDGNPIPDEPLEDESNVSGSLKTEPLDESQLQPLQIPENATIKEVRKALESYLKQLQGKIIQTSDGKTVRFSGKSTSHLANDVLKKANYLIPLVITKAVEVLKTGAFINREELYKERNDGFIAFHTYQKWVDVENIKMLLQVKAGELNNGILEAGDGLIAYSAKNANKAVMDNSLIENGSNKDEHQAGDRSSSSTTWATSLSDVNYHTAEFDDVSSDEYVFVEILEVRQSSEDWLSQKQGDVQLSETQKEVQYLQEIIDGKIDVFAPEFADKLETIAEHLEGGEYDALLNQAVDYYIAKTDERARQYNLP